MSASFPSPHHLVPGNMPIPEAPGPAGWPVFSGANGIVDLLSSSALLFLEIMYLKQRSNISWIAYSPIKEKNMKLYCKESFLPIFAKGSCDLKKNEILKKKPTVQSDSEKGEWYSAFFFYLFARFLEGFLKASLSVWNQWKVYKTLHYFQKRELPAGCVRQRL